MRAISVDLPAFGNPTSPTSASSFSSNRSSLISPGAPAARHEDALSLFGEIGEQARRRVAVAGLFVHERADRNGELEIRAGLTRAIRALAVCSAVGGKLRMESVVDEGVDVRAGDD